MALFLGKFDGVVLLSFIYFYVDLGFIWLFKFSQGLTGLKMLGIVHADLKPDNIMFCAGIGNNHRVKIIDFGWSFYIRDAGSMYDVKLQAVPYRAPEVCFQGSMGHGLDVWALGCIAPEIVTGVKLFDVAEERLLARMMVRALDVPEFWASDVRAEEEREDDDDGGGGKTTLSRGWIYFQVKKNSVNVSTGGREFRGTK